VTTQRHLRKRFKCKKGSGGYGAGSTKHRDDEEKIRRETRKRMQCAVGWVSFSLDESLCCPSLGCRLICTRVLTLECRTKPEEPEEVSCTTAQTLSLSLAGRLLLAVVSSFFN
jgi:hypothetical protein